MVLFRELGPGLEPGRNDNDSLMIARATSSLRNSILPSQGGNDFALPDRKYKRRGDGTIGISRGSSNIVVSTRIIETAMYNGQKGSRSR